MFLQTLMKGGNIMDDEEIGSSKLVELENGKQYILGNSILTKKGKNGNPHYFYIAIALGSKSDVFKGEFNKEDVKYTVLETWEKYNPATGKIGVKMCECHNAVIIKELVRKLTRTESIQETTNSL